MGSGTQEQALVRRWMPDPLALLELWRHEGRRTARAFGFFNNEDLPWRPAPMERSIGQLLTHIANARCVTAYWLLAPSDASPRSHPAEPMHQPDLLSAKGMLADASDRLFRVLAELPAERFADIVTPYGEREARGVMALGMLKHELHHRGELHAYARVLGRQPVSLYTPFDG